MDRRFFGLALALMVTLLAGCRQDSTVAPALRADYYATALQRHKPLGRIVGVTAQPLPTLPGADRRFQQAIDYADANDSYALLIWHGGRLVVEHYFPPYSAELRSESASMHKSVLGLLVAAAISNGTIDSADDPAGRYLADWANDPRGQITIRQMLTMSAGLKPLATDGGPVSATFRFFQDGPVARRTAINLPAAHPPGQVFSYQEPVPQLLLMVLETATGQSYETYLSQRLWQPLGAEDAFVWRNEPDGFARAYTALMARPRDWLRVGLLVKNRGRAGDVELIAPSVMDQLTAGSGANPNYGWLLWRGHTYQEKRYYNSAKTTFSVAASAPYLVDDLLYFDGFGGQRVYISRKKDLVIVRLGALQRDWDDAILPNLILEAIAR